LKPDIYDVTFPKHKISVCIITKNEEYFIESCLLSVIPIAYEIIILDTGSTDKTLDVCRDLVRNGHACSLQTLIKIYEKTWEDDFSKARNECISYATGDWILSIDADEILAEDTQKQLFNFLKNSPLVDKPVIFNFKIKNQENYDSPFFRSTLFKSGFGIKFFRPVHEQLNSEKIKPVFINCPSLTIYHNGSSRSKEDLVIKTSKYVSQLLKCIKENEKQSDNYYYYYYLGNTYSEFDTRKYDEALNAYYESIKLFKISGLNKHSSFYGNILMRTIESLIFGKKDYDTALGFINELREMSPDFPDVLYYLGYCNQYKKNYQLSIKIYEQILDLLNQKSNINPFGIITMEEFLPQKIIFQLGRCYLAINEKENGISFLLQAYNLAPTSKKIIFHLIKYYLLEDNLNKAIYYYSKFKSIVNETDLLSVNIHEKSFSLRLLTSLRKIDDLLEEESKDIEKKVKELSPKISICIMNNEENKYTEECITNVSDIAYDIFIINDPYLDNYKSITVKGDWVLFINSSEELPFETKRNLLSFLAEQDKNQVSFSLLITNPGNDNFFRKSIFKIEKNCNLKQCISLYFENLKKFADMRCKFLVLTSKTINKL
jgi:glycosyltransferase involved in cell wall biosynthesis